MSYFLPIAEKENIFSFFLTLLHFILSFWELLYIISVRGETFFFFFCLQNSKFTVNFSLVNSGLTL